MKPTKEQLIEDLLWSVYSAHEEPHSSSAVIEFAMKEIRSTLTTIQQETEREIEALQKENKRLRSALDWIALVSNKNNPHLGRPRSSEKECIFCMAYLAVNDRAYGEHVDYEALAKQEMSASLTQEKEGK